MIDMRKMLHIARFATVLVAALAISACAKNAEDAQANAAGQATPGSQQDFVVNVGDRVFFESDSSELTPQSIATLDKLCVPRVLTHSVPSASSARPTGYCSPSPTNGVTASSWGLLRRPAGGPHRRRAALARRACDLRRRDPVVIQYGQLPARDGGCASVPRSRAGDGVQRREAAAG